MRRSIALFVAIAAFALVAVAAASLLTGGRWSCESEAELERTRAPEEVVDAFNDAGVELAPTAAPQILGDDRPYRAARAYRYDTERATLWVIVCRARCAGAPAGLGRPRAVDGRQLRQFSTLGNNVAIFMTDNEGRSGRRLQARLQNVVDDIDAAEDYGSRCYIQ